jgi:hypothetical protein
MLCFHWCPRNAGLAAGQNIEEADGADSTPEVESLGEDTFEVSPCIAREYGIYGEVDAAAAAAGAAAAGTASASADGTASVAAVPSTAVEFLADQQCAPLFMPGRLLGIGGMKNCQVGHPLSRSGVLIRLWSPGILCIRGTCGICGHVGYVGHVGCVRMPNCKVGCPGVFENQGEDDSIKKDVAAGSCESQTPWSASMFIVGVKQRGGVASSAVHADVTEVAAWLLLWTSLLLPPPLPLLTPLHV